MRATGCRGSNYQGFSERQELAPRAECETWREAHHAKRTTALPYDVKSAQARDEPSATRQGVA